MQKRDVFSQYHPIVNLIYFVLVLAFTMFFMHPACLAISFFSALIYSLRLQGKRAARRLPYMLPMMLMAAIINPAFNHRGATILAYFPSGSPLTLESISYGLAAAVMLGSVVVWFGCCNEVMGPDKFLCLTGRIAPSLSLMLSMILRFVPVFSGRIREVYDAQRSLGRGDSGKGLIKRARSGLAVLSVVVTWSLENAIETADSMKGRGYGLPGRTAFLVYRFDGRDRLAFLWLLLCGALIAAGGFAGGLDWRYYPTMRGAATGTFFAGLMLLYLTLCLTPVILNIREARKWKHLKSKT
jgi:energy-coupling factor transport system permease protein